MMSIPVDNRENNGHPKPQSGTAISYPEHVALEILSKSQHATQNMFLSISFETSIKNGVLGPGFEHLARDILHKLCFENGC